MLYRVYCEDFKTHICGERSAAHIFEVNMDGIVIVDKPAGWTSQDVTAKLRGVFQTRRIGHGGTLDPMATGVLPVYVGRATRGVEFFEHADKVYEATLRLGITTDTEDITGTTLEEKPVSVTEAAIKAVLEQFKGEIQQIPPMYSAIKINGQKLVDLARKGKEVERKSRTITVFALDFLGMTGNDVRLRVHCSKGTYIRTLCKDIGEKLGCGGCMAQLRRIAAGSYTEKEAIALSQLVECENPGQYLRNVDTLFAHYPAVTLTEKQALRTRNGNCFSIDLPDGTYRAYDSEGEFLMLAKVDGGVMSTTKSFFNI